MKRRTHNKIVKRFCEDYSLDIAWFSDCQGQTIGQLKASLRHHLNNLEDFYYCRYYGF